MAARKNPDLQQDVCQKRHRNHDCWCPDGRLWGRGQVVHSPAGQGGDPAEAREVLLVMRRPARVLRAARVAAGIEAPKCRDCAHCLRSLGIEAMDKCGHPKAGSFYCTTNRHPTLRTLDGECGPDGRLFVQRRGRPRYQAPDSPDMVLMGLFIVMAVAFSASIFVVVMAISAGNWLAGLAGIASLSFWIFITVRPVRALVFYWSVIVMRWFRE